MTDLLTPSENEVMQLIAQGYIQKEVAEKRCVAFTTVRKQVKNAIERTGAKSLYELVARYAQANPDLFKNTVVVLFLGLQMLLIATPNNVDQRRMSKRAKAGRTVRTSLKTNFS